MMREIGARNAAGSAAPMGHKQHNNFVLTYGQCRNHHLAACKDIPSSLPGTAWISLCWGSEPLTDLRLLANNKKTKEEII